MITNGLGRRHGTGKFAGIDDGSASFLNSLWEKDNKNTTFRSCVWFATVTIFLIGYYQLIVFHLSGPSGLASPTSQFLNGMHEFSEPVLTRMSLLMDQSRSVLPPLTFPFKLARTSSFRPPRTYKWKTTLDLAAKAQKFGELWQGKCTWAPWSFHLNWPEPVLSVLFGRPERTNRKWPKSQWQVILRLL